MMQEKIMNTVKQRLADFSEKENGFEAIGMFELRLIADIEGHLKDKEIASNLATIGVTGVYNGGAVYDVTIDGESIIKEGDNDASLISRMALKAIEVIRFNYELSAEATIEVDLSCGRDLSGKQFIYFVFLGDGLKEISESCALWQLGFPNMKKVAFVRPLSEKQILELYRPNK